MLTTVLTCNDCGESICLDYHTVGIPSGVEEWGHRICYWCDARPGAEQRLAELITVYRGTMAIWDDCDNVDNEINFEDEIAFLKKHCKDQTIIKKVFDKEWATAHGLVYDAEKECVCDRR